jgi:hypothetical protein
MAGTAFDARGGGIARHLGQGVAGLHRRSLPPRRLACPLFALAGSDGFRRPFELATVRLRNMIEVLGHCRTDVPRDDFLTQRGGTDLQDAVDNLLDSFPDQGSPGVFVRMARALGFLDPWWPEPEAPLIPGTPRTACRRPDGETRD